jgi:hypothetical protein
VKLFTGHLTQRQSGPVQMLVDVADVPPSVLNVSRYYGRAAVAHVLRAIPRSDVPALAGIYVLLPGVDRDADEAAIAAVESSRDRRARRSRCRRRRTRRCGPTSARCSRCCSSRRTP